VLVQRKQRLVDSERRSNGALWRVSSQAIASTSASTWTARKLMSARLPIGVATTYSAPCG
jgi:hypothetical protein